MSGKTKTVMAALFFFGSASAVLADKILGARAQIDLASGKFQGVQENVDQVMQLIMAAAGARANDECA